MLLGNDRLPTTASVGVAERAPGEGRRTCSRAPTPRCTRPRTTGRDRLRAA